MKIELTSNKILKKLLLIFTPCLIIGLSVYFLRPLKKTVLLFPMEAKGKIQLSCEIVVGTQLFPLPQWKDEGKNKVEASISTGGSRIAVEIGEKTIKFLTSTSVESGIIEPAEFTIVSNDDKSLVAVLYEGSAGIAKSRIANSFILDKKSGLAVWTKSRDSFITDDIPDSQTYYLQCY